MKVSKLAHHLEVQVEYNMPKSAKGYVLQFKRVAF